MPRRSWAEERRGKGGVTADQRFWLEEGRIREVSRREEEERRRIEEEQEDAPEGAAIAPPLFPHGVPNAPMFPPTPSLPPISPLHAKYNKYIKINNERIQDTGIR
jgi:hypothetical protein